MAGIACPYCRGSKTHILGGGKLSTDHVRRRRQCECGKVFVTVEYTESSAQYMRQAIGMVEATKIVLEAIRGRAVADQELDEALRDWAKTLPRK
jgi:transcriptional regulator NrdR family protein